MMLEDDAIGVFYIIKELALSQMLMKNCMTRCMRTLLKKWMLSIMA